MASVLSGEEILPKANPLSRVHQRYRQTTDRQTDRQTDGIATAKART